MLLFSLTPPPAQSTVQHVRPVNLSLTACHYREPRKLKTDAMKRVIIFLLAVIIVADAAAQSWSGKWISTMENQSASNSWMAYRKRLNADKIPATAIARIAADSKYWLWINGKQVVFEGGLKRGPNPLDTYYDTVNIAPYLQKGENTIALLLWYFGKDGFSHKSSGRAGLIFDCTAGDLQVNSDKTWKCAILPAYQTAGAPFPNFRLPEPSILYDARKATLHWQENNYDDKWMPQAMELGVAGSYPWNKLHLRPIPMWKDEGLKDYPKHPSLPFTSAGDTVVCVLPYNAQITPYLQVEAAAGQKITIATDNYLFYCSETSVRAEYITRDGIQEFECPGWMNGHKVYYFIPAGVKVTGLKYRETGYNTEFEGSFTSSDPFLNKLWEKAKRTLYINMRDTYMDCPERERAQWTGDAVIESGQAFYVLSHSSHALTRKWLNELLGWQRPDSSLYAPVPAGNWDSELPGQVAASVGYYGLWNYYLHTGDKPLIESLYAGVQRYLGSWRPDGKGTMQFRPGGWTWGDWGEERDMELLFNLWYYLAVKGMNNMALALGKTADAENYSAFMDKFRSSFNQQFWTGTAYRHPSYTGKTDDRAQALAIVAGVAEKEKYPALLKVFQTEEHASPYMEKYVLEAMFQMGYVKEALQRHEKRFGYMVNYPGFTTLFEGWGIGKEGFGGGTINHAWSGGGLTVLSQYLCGIAPIEPAYKRFQIMPQPGDVKNASAVVPSVAGKISSSFNNQPGKFTLKAIVPAGTTALIGIPNNGYTKIMLNNQVIWAKGRYKKYEPTGQNDNAMHVSFSVPPGEWQFVATK